MLSLEDLEARDRPIHEVLREAFDRYTNANEAERPEAKRRCLEALRTPLRAFDNSPRTGAPQFHELVDGLHVQLRQPMLLRAGSDLGKGHAKRHLGYPYWWPSCAVALAAFFEHSTNSLWLSG
jgi:hypothetical protein